VAECVPCVNGDAMQAVLHRWVHKGGPGLPKWAFKDFATIVIHNVARDLCSEGRSGIEVKSWYVNYLGILARGTNPHAGLIRRGAIG
jgi:hypothetical protein